MCCRTASLNRVFCNFYLWGIVYVNKVSLSLRSSCSRRVALLLLRFDVVSKPYDNLEYEKRLFVRA